MSKRIEKIDEVGSQDPSAQESSLNPGWLSAKCKTLLTDPESVDSGLLAEIEEQLWQLVDEYSKSPQSRTYYDTRHVGYEIREAVFMAIRALAGVYRRQLDMEKLTALKTRVSDALQSKDQHSPLLLLALSKGSRFLEHTNEELTEFSMMMDGTRVKVSEVLRDDDKN